MKYILLSIGLIIGLIEPNVTHANDQRSQLLESVKQEPIRVLVSLKEGRWPETRDQDAVVIAHNIALIEQFLKTLPQNTYSGVSKFYVTGGLALRVNQQGLEFLFKSPMVSSVMEDVVLDSYLSGAKSSMSYQTVKNVGITGAGTTIAIIDSGVNHNNRLVRGRIVDGACFSSDSGLNISACPKGGESEEGSTAGQPVCIGTSCEHGQVMANIAAGNYGSDTYDGIAPQANIIPVTIYHKIHLDNCIGIYCYNALVSNMFRALNWLYFSHRNKLSAINLSIGYIDEELCNASTQPNAAKNVGNIITALRNNGVPVVASTGNQELRGRLAFPACLTQTTSVAATHDNGKLWLDSNVANSLDLMAPGGST